MNKLLEINRDLRDIPDPRLSKTLLRFKPIKGSREHFIRKIQTTYGYDRDTAEKSFEYMKYNRNKYLLGKYHLNLFLKSFKGAACGTAAATFAGPFSKAAH